MTISELKDRIRALRLRAITLKDRWQHSERYCVHNQALESDCPECEAQMDDIVVLDPKIEALSIALNKAAYVSYSPYSRSS